jgi:glutamate-ammonia-ligase adenylyltransferase
VEKLSDHLSELADIMLDLTLPLVWRKLLKRHREAPRFAVIAYGKLGGKELGYASDLDIIFLYDDDHPTRRRPTRAGAAPQHLDLQRDAGRHPVPDRPAPAPERRIRPAGELARGLPQYQMESAWVWEHQALTRARFSAGDAGIGRAFEAIRIEVLRSARPGRAASAK